MDTWHRLEGEVYHQLWDRFDVHFRFCPSTRSEDWPGILEPVPSKTYAIGHIYGHRKAVELEVELDGKVLAALRRCVPPEGVFYALDWQHPSYIFHPHAATPTNLLVPVLPNGDYYIFLALDFSFGLFGHPWEQTICVFGNPLLEALTVDPPRLLDRLVRINGQVV